jgi:TolA-binding protein
MDLHPEDLIERAETGELSPSERERLALHLEHCPACRLERRTRDDFRRVADRADPDVHALVASVLRPDRARPRPQGRARLTRLRYALVAAALLGTGLAAAAATLPGIRALWAPPASPETPSSSPATPAASRRDKAGVTDVTAPAAAIPSEASAHVAAPMPPRATEATAEGPVARLTRHASFPTGAVSAASADAASLFSKANAARRRGDHEGAATTYRQLLDRYAGSPEAHESRMVVGRMLLDDGDASGALRSFEAYRSGGGGALDEEAVLGEALSLEKLGRVEEERRVWTALVAAYPDSVHADRARARLAELGH